MELRSGLRFDPSLSASSWCGAKAPPSAPAGWRPGSRGFARRQFRGPLKPGTPLTGLALVSKQLRPDEELRKEVVVALRRLVVTA